MKKRLQRRRMPTFVAAFGMARTRGRGHQQDRAELAPAVLAGVLTLFATLIKFMLTFMTAVRMFDTGGGN